jgi:hypothetical protein
LQIGREIVGIIGKREKIVTAQDQAAGVIGRVDANGGAGLFLHRDTLRGGDDSHNQVHGDRKGTNRDRRGLAGELSSGRRDMVITGRNAAEDVESAIVRDGSPYGAGPGQRDRRFGHNRSGFIGDLASNSASLRPEPRGEREKQEELLHSGFSTIHAQTENQLKIATGRSSPPRITKMASDRWAGRRREITPGHNSSTVMSGRCAARGS